MGAYCLSVSGAALACFCLVAPAAAQAPELGGIITGLDVDRVLTIARSYGPADRRIDDYDNSPWIRAEIDGIVYTISFLNCQDGQNCSSVQFRAWWTSEGAHTIEQMNQWNRERRFSAAYLDNSGNATIEFDVNLAGGVTAVNFDDTVQWWRAVLREFRSIVIDPAPATPEMPPPPLSK